MSHTICWFDLPVLNLDRAIAFYRNVLARDVLKHTHDGIDYAVFQHQFDNDEVSGCLIVTETAPQNNGPLLYFSVNGRLDAAVVLVPQFGGQVLQPKHALGPYGYRAIVLDSEGNRIALHSETA